MTELACSSSSTNSVRSTRCGTPSTCGRHDRVGDACVRGSSASPSRARCSRGSAGSACPSRCRPRRTRARRRGRARRRSRRPRSPGCRPRRPPAAAAASSATEPVWPPPSPPCTITASTPHAATFSAWRRAPIDGTDADAGVLQRLDLALVRRERERRDRARCSRDQQVDALGRRLRRRRAGSRRTGASVRSLHLADRGARAGRSVIVADARMPSAPAPRVALDEPRPRDPAHARLHDRHVDAEQVADSGPAARMRHGGTSCSPRPIGSIASRISWSSSSVGSRELRHVGVDRELEPGRGDARRRRSRPGAPTRSRMRWSGVSKSSTPRLRHDAAEAVEPAGTGAEVGAPGRSRRR